MTCATLPVGFLRLNVIGQRDDVNVMSLRKRHMRNMRKQETQKHSIYSLHEKCERHLVKKTH